jgi:hypothetical protein
MQRRHGCPFVRRRPIEPTFPEGTSKGICPVERIYPSLQFCYIGGLRRRRAGCVSTRPQSPSAGARPSFTCRFARPCPLRNARPSAGWSTPCWHRQRSTRVPSSASHGRARRCTRRPLARHPMGETSVPVRIAAPQRGDPPKRRAWRAARSCCANHSHQTRRRRTPPDKVLDVPAHLRISDPP